METLPEEIARQPEESKNSADQNLPPEEPISLKKLFPQVNQDLDILFPEPAIKELLRDVVRTRQKNERFLKRVQLREIPSEEEDAAETS